MKVLAIIAIAFGAVLCLIVLAWVGIIVIGEWSQRRKRRDE